MRERNSIANPGVRSYDASHFGPPMWGTPTHDVVNTVNFGAPAVLTGNMATWPGTYPGQNPLYLVVTYQPSSGADPQEHWINVDDLQTVRHVRAPGSIANELVQAYDRVSPGPPLWNQPGVGQIGTIPYKSPVLIFGLGAHGPLNFPGGSPAYVQAISAVDATLVGWISAMDAA